MKEFLEEIRFSTAKEFVHALLPSSGLFEEKKNYIFRGHEDATFKLIPQVLRPDGRERMEKMSRAYAKGSDGLVNASVFSAFYEFQLIRDFYKVSDECGLYVPLSDRLRKKIHHLVDVHSLGLWVDGDTWLPDDMLEATGLAQHYGVPTRLLDWTYDPLIAAFFASSSIDSSEGDLCIWVLCQTELVLLELNDPAWPLVFSQPHYDGNPNLAAQKGLFTHWKTKLDSFNTLMEKEELRSFQVLDRRSLDEQIRSYCVEAHKGCPSGVFKKLVLPRSEMVEFARLLRAMKYGPARIFPGYGGVAKELSERYKFRRPIPEMGD
ncbi:FRG domain-containing protein [Pseudomonas soli]|uniref:FRG domain-containing protein n=1 Tax=Pseudomonas soli TaxID=1306993 RepID=UPI00382E64A6